MEQKLLAEIGQIIWKWQLHPEVAARFAVINMILQIIGYPGLEIVSGYRDARLQAQLWENWNAGLEIHPVGMPATEPACDSMHLVTQGGFPASLAFDAIGEFNSKEVFAYLWEIFQDARWGGWFEKPDPNHYDAYMPFTQRNPIC